MKKATLILLASLFNLTVFGQDVTGQWNGALKIQGTQFRLVFNITETENGISSTMDSPDQGAKGIPTTTTSFEKSILKITIANAKIEYEGTLGQDNIIVGTFKQGGQSFPMNLSKEKIEKEKIIRPQEPTKPYSYISEDIMFPHLKAGFTLSGTLTLPAKEGIFPVVILITGSGPQNRDEELMGHKPFLVISDHLTKNGIAVFRYDDRGVGQSKGDFKSATTADFATDVESAIAYLKKRKEIDKNKIGLVGHSEGGIIASMVASKLKDVSYVVLLAGTGIRGDELLLFQQELIAKAEGESEDEIKKSIQRNTELFQMIVKSEDLEKLKADLTNKINEIVQENGANEIPNGMDKDEFVSMQVSQLSSPWMIHFLKYNPASALEKVKCPVLALNGEKDLQVPSKVNLEAIKNALTTAGNKSSTTKKLANLNHLFQECQTGSPSEYSTIEQTFSPIALDEVTRWIHQQIK